jgi:hypothetical protein
MSDTFIKIGSPTGSIEVTACFIILSGLSAAVATGHSFEVAYSVFEPGQFIRETGPAKRVHFFGAETMFRF